LPAVPGWPSGTTAGPSTWPGAQVQRCSWDSRRWASWQCWAAEAGSTTRCDVIDYFTRTGSWGHLWPTLRNLAELLHWLGDAEPAALIDAAADNAPDAPARDTPTGTAVELPVPHRDAVLDLARQAIERHLPPTRRASRTTR
jgi:hypothetical protein